MMVLRCLLLLVVLGCGGPNANRVLPAVAAEGETSELRFAMAFGDESGSTLVVSSQPWSAGKRLTLQHSFLFVQLEHKGDQPLRFRETDFVLRAGERDYVAVELERIVNNSGAGLQEARSAASLGLRPITLEPGETTQGYVFFRKKFEPDDWGEGDLVLRVTLFDQSHETPLETLELPLSVGR